MINESFDGIIFLMNLSLFRADDSESVWDKKADSRVARLFVAQYTKTAENVPNCH
jgi:hypothetical protein